MYDYDDLGDTVTTPIGKGRYLSHKNGKVLVVMWNLPPIEFNGDDVTI